MAADHLADVGDERMGRWVREHARAVRGYVLGLVRREDAADDLVQEVFRRAWQARERYRDEGHERAYLLRIADRLVVDRSRRLGREVNLDDAAWCELEPERGADLPFARLETQERDEGLTRSLDALTGVQKRVLLLRYFGEMSFEEIAETVGCPLGTALSHCRRGLTALRKLMVVKTDER